MTYLTPPQSQLPFGFGVGFKMTLAKLTIFVSQLPFGHDVD